jgi:diguanylate cyclase (GGDEF)-like protein
MAGGLGVSRWHLVLILILVLGAGLITIYGNLRLHQYPLLPFTTQWQGDTLVVTEVPAGSPFQPDDRFVSVDGLAVAGIGHLFALNDIVRAGSWHNIRVERDGRQVQIDLIPDPVFPSFLPWVALVVSLAVLVIALGTFLIKPGAPSILNFVVSQAGLAVLIGTLQPTDYATSLIYWFFFFITPVLFFRLLAVLPEEEALRRQLQPRVQQMVGLGLVLAIVAMLVINIRYVHPETYRAYLGVIRVAWWIMIGLNGAAIIALLVYGLTVPMRWVRSLRARRKLQWFLWGMVAGIGPFLIASYIPFQVLRLFDLPVQRIVLTVTTPFMILVPLSTAVAILRYQLLDIDFLIWRSVRFIAALLAVMLGGTLATMIILRWIWPAGWSPLYVYLIIPVLVILTFPYSERLMARFITQRYKEFDYDLLETVEKYSAQLCDTVSREQIMNLTARLALRLLAPEWLLFVFRDRDGRTVPTHWVNIPDSFLTLLNQKRFDDVFGPGDSDGTTTLAINPVVADFRLAVPIHAAGCSRGLLMLGRKKGESDYTVKDQRFLNILADQVGIALRSINEMDNLAKEIQASGQESLKSFWDRLQSLRVEKDQLEKMAMTDPLTGCGNRRFFYNALQRECHRAIRFGETFGLAMMDLDHFKQVNDAYGHAAGDHVLQEVAEVTRKAVRNTDILCRFGGEEFVLILAYVDKESLYIVSEKIRQAIEATTFSYGNFKLRIAVSIGSTIVSGQHGVVDSEQVVNRADRAMYFAKYHGRNQSVLYEDLPQEWKFIES